VIIGRATVLTAPENIVWLIAPSATAIFGLTIYNYLIMYEQRSLFCLERDSKKQQEEQTEIINLLPGSVFILNMTYSRILFKNSEFSNVEWISESGHCINETYKFKIVPQITVLGNKKDAVRLYEEPLEDELEQNEEL
jgi:hypothetical protein